LPDAGTKYENVCNVIEYSSNKYFASYWYKQKKTEIKLDINLLSKTNKYKTKQTNQKYQTERKKTKMNAPFINLT
jgi:hypothetical protein